jgi:hypothetical protein
MPISELIQRIINILDGGTGSRVTRVCLIGTIFLGVGLWFDLRQYKNFSTLEAMDSAQLARNISEGRGFTTDFVRPLSVYLVNRWNEAKRAGQPGPAGTDFARLQTAHPDLANPPVYPLFLAGLMKILPFHYAVETKKNFWSEDGNFARYEPDFLIAVINQLLLLVVVWQTFLIARKLFDAEVAWVSAILVFGCQMLWSFSISGLSTILVIIIFLGLTRLLISVEELAREPVPDRRKLVGLVVAVGLVAGLGALTRYSFGWVIVPVAAFLALFGGADRWRQTLIAGGTFLAVLAPWIIRNFMISGTPFGTASFAITEGNVFFPGFILERSLHPEMNLVPAIMPYLQKFGGNLKDVLQNDLPRLGGSWVTMLFFAGLLMSFQRGPVRRLRYFLLMCLGMLIVVQALGRTQLSVASPVVNSENLLVLLLPLVLIYGTVFFFTLLDQTEMPLQVPLQSLRYGAMVIFIVIMSFPLIGSAFESRVSPKTYPPYYPPDLQKIGTWMKPNELLMSDIPWAVAWYGHHQCIWLSLNTQSDFFALYDYIKPVRGVFLSMETTNSKIYDDCLFAPSDSWGNFLLGKIKLWSVQALVHNATQSNTQDDHVDQLISRITADPSTFPLTFIAENKFIISGLFFTDRIRWTSASAAQ